MSESPLPIAPSAATEQAAADTPLTVQFPHLPPRKHRWSRHKMAEFLRELAMRHCVADAAKAVGMSRQSAYRLRARLKGTPFDVAWEAAFQHGYDALHQAALERALHGVEVHHYHGGELVGISRRYDESLTRFLLGQRNRLGGRKFGRYNAAAEFWSERWDSLLDRIEYGELDWQYDPEVHNPADADERHSRNLAKKHAAEPDPNEWKGGIRGKW